MTKRDLAESSVLEPLPKSLIAASQPCMIVQTLCRQNTEKNKGGSILPGERAPRSWLGYEIALQAL